MKFTIAIKLFLLTALNSIIMVSCNNDEKPTVVLEAPKTVQKLPNPFPFYKSMEIKPGFNFEVLSWGKGVDSLGGYLILMSDSVKNNFKSIAIERKGILADAWNMDLDNDGNPELYLQSVVRKNVNDLNVYEYTNGGFSKLSFPGLSKVNGYVGNDAFFIKNGELFRKVPVVKIDSGKTTTLVKTLKYNLRGNEFSSSEVEDK